MLYLNAKVAIPRLFLQASIFLIALHFVYYNFAKIHKKLRFTPAMETGLTKDIMSIEDIVKLAEK